MDNQLPDEFRAAPKWFKVFWINHFVHLCEDVKLISRDERQTKRMVIALLVISVTVPIAVTLGILQLWK